MEEVLVILNWFKAQLLVDIVGSGTTDKVLLFSHGN